MWENHKIQHDRFSLEDNKKLSPWILGLLGNLKILEPSFQDDADWFLKADDDTYIIVENLRHLLKDKNSSDPVYFGHKLRIDSVQQGIFSGGAGYVLSKEALRRSGRVKLVTVKFYTHQLSQIVQRLVQSFSNIFSFSQICGDWFEQ